MNKVIELLKANTQMTLATSSGDSPRSSIMECIMVGDSLIFSTDPNSIKGKNLAKNPKVSLTTGNPAAYVAIDGTVTAPRKDEIEGYNKILIARYPYFKDILAADPEKFKHFKVVFGIAHYTEGMSKHEVIDMRK